jgi:hypothetical protein
METAPLRSFTKTGSDDVVASGLMEHTIPLADGEDKFL